jgi:hypothetical protein
VGESASQQTGKGIVTLGTEGRHFHIFMFPASLTVSKGSAVI